MLDLLLAGAALAVLAVPLLVVMVVLRLTGEGDVWFRQERVGFRGRRFRVFKFVTMRRDSEHTGTRDITLRNDPRVFPVGRFLRMTKLNEVPQLFNIILGDMSVVGWRPLMPVSFGLYSDRVQERIVAAKPGLTGIGSIVFRDEEAITARATKPAMAVYREDIAPYKGALELWYQANQSLWVDVKLIAATALVVLLPRAVDPHRWFPGLPPKPAWMA